MSQDQPIDPTILFEKHGVFVSRLARALVADEHTAEDLAHETWAAVLRRPPVGVRNVRAWLSTILKRRVAIHRRRAGSGTRVGPLDPSSAQVAAQDADQQLEYEHVLHAAVRALGEPYRTTVYLRFHEGLPPRLIAERTGVPVKTVKTRLFRALAKLRLTLDGKFGDAADGGRDWRLALAPIWISAYRASKGASKGATTAAAIPFGGSTAPLFLSMKKLIVAAVLLVISIGWLALRSVSVNGELTPGIEGRGSAALIATEDEVAVAPLADAGKRQQVAASAPVPEAAAILESAAGVIALEVKDGSDTPIPGRTIVLKAWPWASAGEPAVFRRTDRAGRVTFSGLAASHLVVSDGQGDTEEEVELKHGERRELTWVVEKDVLVRGRVVTDRGDPVPGAEIWVSPSLTSEGLMWPATSAGADGGFAVRCSPDAVLQATVHGLLPSPAHQVQKLREVESGVREVTLALGATGCSLGGRVVDVFGRPIEGAMVIVRPEGWPASAEPSAMDPKPMPAVSDQEGRFDVSSGVPPGDHPVVVRAKGFAAIVSPVKFSEIPGEVEFVLYAGVEVSGIVLAPDGEPAAKAHVWSAMPSSRWQAYGRGLGPSVRTDSEGRFTLRRVPLGQMEVRARAGWTEALSRASAVVDVGGDHVVGLQLELELGRTILGRTVDDEGFPVPDAVVTAIGLTAQSSDVVSGRDGSFEITALPEPGEGTADEWELVVRTWTGTSTRVLGRQSRVAPNGEPVDIVVERIGAPTGTIVGRITASSGRIPGDVKATLGNEGRSNGMALGFDPNSGAFSKGSLRPGTYRIQVSRGGVPVTGKSSLVVGPGETIDAGVIHLDDGGSIEVFPAQPVGLGLDSAALESLLPAASASLVGPGGNQVWLEWREGAWRHTGTLEPGVWRVLVFSGALVFPEREVSVVPGETVRVDLSATLARTVKVQVQLPQEATWSEVQLSLVTEGGDVLYQGEPQSRSDLKDPNSTEVRWTVPVGPLGITVTTDTGVGVVTTFAVEQVSAGGDMGAPLTLTVTAQ